MVSSTQTSTTELLGKMCNNGFKNRLEYHWPRRFILEFFRFGVDVRYCLYIAKNHATRPRETLGKAHLVFLTTLLFLSHSWLTKMSFTLALW